MEELTSYLVQVPILALFMWYVIKQNNRWDENNNQWRQYLTERNSKLEKSLKEVSDTMERISGKINDHNNRN